MIAVAAVILLTARVGGAPVIALGLAFSFGLYGVVKKVVPVEHPPVGLFVSAPAGSSTAGIWRGAEGSSLRTAG